MTFVVGDRVRVITKRFGREQFGLEGEIIECRGPGDYNLDYSVMFSDHRNAYDARDLKMVPPGPSLVSDFSLDELAIAEDIISQMG